MFHILPVPGLLGCHFGALAACYDAFSGDFLAAGLRVSPPKKSRVPPKITNFPLCPNFWGINFRSQAIGCRRPE